MRARRAVVLDGRTLNAGGVLPPDVGAAGRLQLRLTGDDGRVVELPVTVRTVGDSVLWQAWTDLHETVGESPGTWRVALVVDGVPRSVRTRAPRPTTNKGRIRTNPPSRLDGTRYVPRVARDGSVSLRVHGPARAARVDHVVHAPGLLRLSISTRGMATTGPAVVELRRRGGGVVAVPTELQDGRCEVRVPLAEVASHLPPQPGEGRRDTWSVHVLADGAVRRAGRRDEDLDGLRRASRFASWVTVGTDGSRTAVRPRFTADRYLNIETERLVPVGAP